MAVNDDMINEAISLQAEAHRHSIVLNGVFVSDLYGIVACRLVEQRARTVLHAVRQQIDATKARQAAQGKAQRAQPSITVRPGGFTAKGRQWPAGAYAITHEDAEALRDWQARMEAERDSRGWDAPVGYEAASWPPFSIEAAH
ncbi:MAG: hypothetical protein WBD55_01120 [Dehalococcoidia bacterium]